MSEFKYACPVCTQHIRCDSSQAGSTMTCPTCFQEIIVPQAPASADQKFILTGTKVGDKPAAKIPELNPYQAPEKKRTSGVLVVLAIFALIALAVGFVYYRTIVHPFLEGKRPGPRQTNAPLATPVAATNPAPPVPHVTPPIADDTNWMLNLADVPFPDSPAAGRIHGQDFLVERAAFSRGTLILRDNHKGPVNFGVTINFKGAQAPALAGQSLNILANTNPSARVTLHWQEATYATNESYEINYALKLEFGSLTNRHLPGRIYLCTPDPQKSYLMGTFNAEVIPHKNPPKK